MWLRLSDVVADLLAQIEREKDRARVAEGWEAECDPARSRCPRASNRNAGKEELMTRHHQAARRSRRA